MWVANTFLHVQQHVHLECSSVPRKRIKPFHLRCQDLQEVTQEGRRASGSSHRATVARNNQYRSCRRLCWSIRTGGRGPLPWTSGL
eukprot:2610494-Pyramimonas_sp.AAC.1